MMTGRNDGNLHVERKTIPENESCGFLTVEIQALVRPSLPPSVRLGNTHGAWRKVSSLIPLGGGGRGEKRRDFMYSSPSLHLQQKSKLGRCCSIGLLNFVFVNFRLRHLSVSVCTLIASAFRLREESVGAIQTLSPAQQPL